MADERAARVRAARSYAGMTAPELAKALNVSKETLSRMENGRRPTSAEELRVIAETTGVPLSFLVEGFNGTVRHHDELEERVSALERILGVAAVAIRRAGRPIPSPPGELGRRAGVDQPTPEDHDRDETPPEEERRRASGQ